MANNRAPRIVDKIMARRVPLDIPCERFLGEEDEEEEGEGGDAEVEDVLAL
jgi:hypothetical protein